MNKFEVYNQTKEIIDNSTIEKIVNVGLNYENINNACFNIIITGNEEIKKINKKYRNIDKETDVISFALEDDNSFPKIDIRILGDIYISFDKVKEQSKLYGHSEKRELAFLIIHGLLHLLGYDHMKQEDEIIMFKKQDEILTLAGIGKKDQNEGKTK